MNSDIILAVVIFFLLAYIAFQEFTHTKHLQTLERRLQGPDVLPPDEPRHGDLREMEIKRPKSIDLDLARNIPVVTEKMQKDGLRFTAQGPEYGDKK